MKKSTDQMAGKVDRTMDVELKILKHLARDNPGHSFGD